MKAAIAVVFVLLTGCASSSVTPYGKDKYMITAAHTLGTTQKAVLHARAAKEATEYCAKQGKQMVVESVENRGVAWVTSTSSQLVFSCV